MPSRIASALVLSLFLSLPAAAAPRVVTSLDDVGEGTLRQAIIDGNLASAPLDLDLTALAGTITLATPLPPVEFDLTLRGPSASALSIATSATRLPGWLVDVTGTAVISGLSVEGPFVNGVFRASTALTLEDVELRGLICVGDASRPQVPLVQAPTVTTRRSRFLNNDAGSDEAVIRATNAVLDESEFWANRVRVVMGLGRVDVSRVTATGCTFALSGRSVFMVNDELIARQCTFTGNGGREFADILITSEQGHATIESCTFAGSGGAQGLVVAHTQGAILLRNNLFARGDTCQYNVPTSLGHNVTTGPGTACGLTHATDVVRADARMGPFELAGGFVRVHRPHPESAAVDRGDDTIEGTDARGMPRKVGAHVDVGAVELAPPQVTSFQADASTGLLPGDPIRLSVVATSPPSLPLHYDWRRDGSSLGGPDEAEFSRISQPGDSGSYDVVVSNGDGFAVGGPVTVEVVDPPVITRNPEGLTLFAGQPLVLTVEASGAELTYAWSTTEAPETIRGRAATLEIPAATVSDAGAWRVTVSNRSGTTASEPVTIVVHGPPVIVESPSGASLLVGDPLRLAVTASGESIEYKWRKDGETIEGATSPTFEREAVTADDTGTYDVLLSNPAGEVVSEPAKVTVQELSPEPDAGQEVVADAGNQPESPVPAGCACGGSENAAGGLFGLLLSLGSRRRVSRDGR